MTFDTLPSLNFPAGVLDVRTELLLNSVWTDISSYVQHDPITIQRGHPDESTTTTPTVLNLSVFNADGRFTARNPAGPYYPYLRRNVPCRVSLPEGASYLRLENDSASYVQGPSTGGVNITGDLEIQLDLTLDNWQVAQTLACKWSQTGNERSWLLEMEDGGTLGFWVSSTGSNQTEFLATVTVPVPPLLRQCLRVTYAHTTGTATFYTAAAGLTGVSWTQLGTAVTSGALTPFGCTAPVLLGARSDGAGWPGMTGKIHAMLLLSGIAGTTEASPDFTAQTAGATSFTDAQSNTWTLEGTSEISNRKYRCHVEMPQWAQNQDPSGHTVYAKLQGGGILRRMSMGITPASSPLTRAYLRLPAADQLAGYWPCEDGTGAGQLASGIGGIPGTATPAVELASSTAFSCSSAIPVLNGGIMNFTVTAPNVTWTDNVIRFLWALPSGDDTNGVAACIAYTTGTIARLDLIYGTGGALTLTGFNATGAQVFTQNATFGVASLEACRISMELTSESGSQYALWVLPPGGAAVGFQNTFTGSIGAVTSVSFGYGLEGSAIGQVSVQGKSDPINDLSSPLNSWYGETAGNRFSRLCGEEGITFRGRGQLSATVAMGNQTVETIQQLLQECVDADLGMWTETRQCLGFGYRTRASVGT